MPATAQNRPVRTQVPAFASDKTDMEITYEKIHSFT